MSDKNKNNVIDFEERIKKLQAISNVPPAQSKAQNKAQNKAGSSSKKQEKIIAFPDAKISSLQQALDADKKFKAILGGRVIATLLGMFVLTIAAQSLWFSAEDTSKHGRVLASSISRSLASMENYLSGSKRGVASVAKLPSRIEEFNFGVLYGRYTIHTKDQFITSLSSNGQPIRVTSVARFLKKYRSLWQLQFASLKLSQSNKDSKIYTLLDEKKKILGKAIISLDGKGNLQSLKFDKTHF